MHINASNDLTFRLTCLQAFVKARGDGLGFDLIKAEFHFDDGVSSNTASVWVDGVQQARWAAGHHMCRMPVEYFPRRILCLHSGIRHKNSCHLRT